nr:unnamed protein product [Digitaria exilis]
MKYTNGRESNGDRSHKGGGGDVPPPSIQIDMNMVRRRGGGGGGSPSFFEPWTPTPGSGSVVVRGGGSSGSSGDPTPHHPSGGGGREPPEKLLTLFALRLAVLEKAASGLGTLNFVWATVVLLGGFVSNLTLTDFWCITVILVGEGARVFGRSHELEWQHHATETSSTAAAAGVLRSSSRFFRRVLHFHAAVSDGRRYGGGLAPPAHRRWRASDAATCNASHPFPTSPPPTPGLICCVGTGPLVVHPRPEEPKKTRPSVVRARRDADTQEDAYALRYTPHGLVAHRPLHRPGRALPPPVCLDVPSRTLTIPEVHLRRGHHQRRPRQQARADAADAGGKERVPPFASFTPSSGMKLGSHQELADPMEVVLLFTQKRRAPVGAVMREEATPGGD